MPEPQDGETQEEFIQRCIPVVLEDGTAEDNKQAVAVCYSMWEQAKKSVKGISVKAVGDWELEVLGIPYGGPQGGKDADGEYFSSKTEFYLDRFSKPLVTYYHGFDPEGNPQGDPEIIGETNGYEKRADGVWWRVVLDKASEYAKRVWEAAKQGIARASSGSISHLVRTATDGEILHWPITELSLLDAVGSRQPANQYAVALPIAQKSYKRAGLELPELPEMDGPETTLETQPGGAVKPQTSPDTNHLESSERVMEGQKIMEEKEVQELVAKQVADALKAETEKREVAEAVAKAEQEKIDAAVKAEREKWEAEAAKANRLSSDDGMPYIKKYGDTDKFDDLTPGEHAFMLSCWKGLYHQRGEGQNITDAAVKALALKADSEAQKGDKHSYSAMKALHKLAPEIKANEVNYSTYSSYGDQWVGVLYHSDLWEKIRAGTWVLSELERGGDVRQIPDGYESDIVPLESTDPIWYKVAQTTAVDSTCLRPVASVTASPIGTAQKSVSLAKMGCRVLFTGEMVEDSLVRWVPNAYRQIQVSGQEQMEHAIIDGDTSSANTTNINDIGAQPAGTAVFNLVDGFRKLGLVTNTANSRDGGVLAVEDFLETLKLMGTAGKHATDRTKVSFVLDPWVHWKALELSEVKTRYVFSGATIENGMLTAIWGYPVKVSHFMHYAGVLLGTVTTAAYQLKANASGKVDQTTESNNTKGAFFAVRWDQWALRWKRRMTMEIDRWPEADTNQIVALLRWGLAYRDSDASAITYNITV